MEEKKEKNEKYDNDEKAYNTTSTKTIIFEF